jgi:N-acetylglucosamine kinase-like BadF-type ATPase
MKRPPVLLPVAVLLALAACGSGGTPAENTAAALDEAAEQSDPAAAEVLENAADQALEQNVADPQQALQQAGDAQAATVPGPQQTAPSLQAQPNRTGQQTPPPKVSTSPAQPARGGNSN